MTHPFDQIDHKLILGLRRGGDVADNVLLAHHTRGATRKCHIEAALRDFDELAKRVADLRAEIARAETKAEGALT